jgi:hypothetical protein
MSSHASQIDQALTANDYIRATQAIVDLVWAIIDYFGTMAVRGIQDAALNLAGDFLGLAVVSAKLVVFAGQLAVTMMNILASAGTSESFNAVWYQAGTPAPGTSVGVTPTVTPMVASTPTPGGSVPLASASVAPDGDAAHQAWCASMIDAASGPVGIGDAYSPSGVQYVSAPPGSEWWCVGDFAFSDSAPRLTIFEMAQNGADCGSTGGSLASAAECYDDWYGDYAGLRDYLNSSGGSYTEPTNLGDRAFAVHEVSAGVDDWRVFVQRGNRVFWWYLQRAPDGDGVAVARATLPLIP